MPNRTLSGAEGYRYVYQGQEKDTETGKEAFELRLWDSRIGRWLTTDPAGQYASPYMGMGNNPITRWDPDGGCDQPDDDCGFFKRNWYNITGRGFLVDRWDFVDSNPNVNWSTFLTLEEGGIAGAYGSYLSTASDGFAQEVNIGETFFSDSLDWEAIGNFAGEILFEEVLERFIKVPIIIIPELWQDPLNDNGTTFAVKGKFSPGRVSNKLFTKWRGNNTKLRQAFLDATKLGFVKSEDGVSGIIKLKSAHKVGSTKYYYELKLAKNTGFGKHRLYGRIQINKNTGSEYILFDTWDKHHRL